jgi:hypothetical protein
MGFVSSLCETGSIPNNVKGELVPGKTLGTEFVHVRSAAYLRTRMSGGVGKTVGNGRPNPFSSVGCDYLLRIDCDASAR